jgi:hypothetical protein
MNSLCYILKRRFFLLSLWACMPLVLLSPLLRAAEGALTEQAKIESLISTIESLNDATFVRNGSEYNAKNAAKFLRGKWDANKEDIKTARDFIDKVATKSSTTGKPYVIRPKGAAEIACAEFLKTALKKLE